MTEQTRLKTGALGAAGITFLVVGAAAPLTVMTGVTPLAISIGGTFTPDALSGPGMPAILGFCFAAFMGFESTALYRAEARQPNRTIPRATYAAVAFLGIFYAVVAWAVVQAFGDTEVVAAATANPSALFFAATQKYAGTWAADAMYMLVLTSIVAAQLAFHNAINRYAFNLAHDRLLPAALGRTHPRYLSPAAAGTTQSILAAVVVTGFALTGADPVRHLLILVNTPGVLGILLLLTLTSVAVLAYFLRRRGVPGARIAIASAALGTILLTLILGVIINKVALLTAAQPATNTALVAVLPVILAAGLAWALTLKTRNPHAYARIGGEDTHHPDTNVPSTATAEATA
jgi:amino acid transporter